MAGELKRLLIFRFLLIDRRVFNIISSNGREGKRRSTLREEQRETDECGYGIFVQQLDCEYKLNKPLQ